MSDNPIKMINTSEEFSASYSLRHPFLGYLLVAIFILIMNAGMLMAVYKSIQDGTVLKNITLLSLFSMISLTLLYLLIVGTFNKTTLRLNQHFLTVHHRPFPSYKEVKILVSEIEQIYVDRNTMKAGLPEGNYNKLMVKLKNGTYQRLLPELLKTHQVLELEKRLEERLKIIDSPVRGELGTIRVPKSDD